MYKKYSKRLIDLFIAFIFLFILSPLLLSLTIILFLTNSGSPFYLQNRPGKNGQIFCLIKFKTMNDKRDSTGKLLSDVQRISAIGHLMRSFSIDELPQLLNVLKGDMSLVGPRPLLISYLSLYDKRQSKRHDVRPGITGWAQINGRNTISWQEKFELDVWYVENVSFILDIRILIHTLIKVFKKEGINSSSNKTMDYFLGNTSK
ncbi:MAG: sugar transferase [Chlorobiaceae bacterium]|nr:sugar transferase [Chlorobiaceae bacterium]